MDDVWEAVRVINFIILFASFVVMVYKGALHLVLEEKIHWDKLVNLAWVVIAIYSIGEVLYLSAVGGFRIFLMTALSIFQLYVVVFHYHREESKA